MKTLDAVIQELFQRHPGLVGFSVQAEASLTRDRMAGQLEGDLCLADMAISGDGGSLEVLGEVAVALLDLMDEEPAARQLMVGRTFARALH